MKKTIAVMAALTASPTFADDAVISTVESQAASVGSEENFLGLALVEPIFPANEFNGHSTSNVTFAPGARTAWHTHPRGQLIIITEGSGWVQVEGQEKRLVRAGDAVWFPPNANHWHGATDTTAMRHIALSYVEGESNVTWGELVSDDDFSAPITE